MNGWGFSYSNSALDESKNAHSKIIYIQTAQQKSWVQQGPFEVNQKIPRTRDGIFSNIRQRHVSENSNVRIEVFNNGGKWNFVANQE